MLLTCPKCEKHYYVDAVDVGKMRPVKCSACATIWVAESSDLVDQPVLTLDRRVPEIKSEGAKAIPASKGFARKLGRSSVVSVRPSRRISLSFIIMLLISVVLINFQPQFLALTKRLIPQFYHGTRVQASSQVFRIQNLKVFPDKKTGGYILGGTIVNTSDYPQETPALVLDLWAVSEDKEHGSSPLTLKESVPCPLPVKTLGPKESLSFTHTFKKPLPWLRSLTVRFDKAGGTLSLQ